MGMHQYKGKELYPKLFSPLRLGNVRLKNRIICAPTSPAMITLDGHMTPQMIAYLEKKAQGGAAVVTYGESIVHSKTGKQHDKQLQLDSYGVREGLTAFKKHVKTPVACVGAIQDPAAMEQIIESGQADVVEIARESLADPFLPAKALRGEAEDITPCLRCYECFGGIEPQEMVRCAVNPVIGQELQARLGVKPAERPKKVLDAVQTAYYAAQRV